MESREYNAFMQTSPYEFNQEVQSWRSLAGNGEKYDAVFLILSYIVRKRYMITN
jgi:hypothetical protein